MLRQITVFLENKPGRMEEVTACLAENSINIHALSLADTADFGILRMIMSDPDKAVRVLKENNFMVKTTEVIAAAIGHSPGSLHKILKELKSHDISIEYMYAFTSHNREHNAIVVLRLVNQDAVFNKLQNSSFPILGENLLDELNKS